MPFFMLAAFLGYTLGLMLFGTFGRSAALAAASGGIAILSNVLRVNTIVLVDALRDSQMELAAHGTFQWLALLVTLAGVFWLVARADAPRSRTATATPAPLRPTLQRRFAPVVAGMAAASIAAAAIALPGTGARHPRDATVGDVAPLHIAGWRLVEPPAAWSLDAAGESESLRLSYAREHRSLQVLVIEMLSSSAKLHEPRPSWGAPDGVWHEKETRLEDGCVKAVRCVTVTHTILQRDHSAQLLHVYATYVLGDTITASRLAVRGMSGLQRLSANAAADATHRPDDRRATDRRRRRRRGHYPRASLADKQPVLAVR